MKNLKPHVRKAEGQFLGAFAETSTEGRMEDVIGTKVLYNWLYQQEEEKYYISARTSGIFPDFSEADTLLVEY